MLWEPHQDSQIPFKDLSVSTRDSTILKRVLPFSDITKNKTDWFILFEHHIVSSKSTFGGEQKFEQKTAFNKPVDTDNFQQWLFV